ncbi:MAG: TraR/DksA C4-type zinc finger protein [Isosphaeraceae bacterium]|nr:TraR/DksA C4-type zinc finger protein [Isosphaeraceae bacterium]
MAHALKPEEVDSFRSQLKALSARLRGDLDQMTDEALGSAGPDASGNLTNVPPQPADVGTENYDQEFTLSLIENEQFTLEQIEDALIRVQAGTYGKCVECGEMVGRERLKAIPYTPFCIDCARAMEKPR